MHVGPKQNGSLQTEKILTRYKNVLTARFFFFLEGRFIMMNFS